MARSRPNGADCHVTTHPSPELSLPPTAFQKGNVPAGGGSDLEVRIAVPARKDDGAAEGR